MKKIRMSVIKNRRWIIAFFTITFFGVILANILNLEIKKFDEYGYGIISKLISEEVTPIAKFITYFGSWFTLIFITIVLIIVIKNKKIKWSIPINLACSFLINVMVKYMVRRERPVGIRIIEEGGFSFPSGHSTVSMAFYGYLIYLIFKNVKSRILKISLITGLSILIILIGLSRIYLGVHFISDVIGGYMLALLYLTVYTAILKNKNI